MGVYQVETEDGAVYEVETDDGETEASGPSFSSDPIGALTSKDWWFTRPSGEKISGVQAVVGPFSRALDSLTFGAGDEIIAAGASLINNKGYDKNLADVRGIQRNFSEASPVVDTALQVAGALKLPIGSSLKATDSALKTVGKLGLEGAAWGGAYGFGEGEGGFGSRADQALENAKTGAVVSPVLGGALAGLGKLGGPLKEAGRKLELSAFGANKTRIGRAFDKSPEIISEMGEKLNPLSEAIASFRKNGGGKNGLNGQRLLDELGGQLKTITANLDNELTKASSKQTDAIIPEFSLTQKYLEGLPGVSKVEATQLAKDLVKKTIDNTDGTLISLQKEKIGLSPLIKEASYGTNANPTKANLLKYIKADLKRAIENGYAKVTGESPEIIKKLNQEIGFRENLEPLFEDLRNSGEARDILKYLWQNFRTSGGLGVAGLVTGNLAVPIVGGLAVTPPGRKAIADGLRSGLLQTPLRKGGQGSALTPRLFSSIFSIGNNSQENEPPKQGLLSGQNKEKGQSQLNYRENSENLLGQLQPEKVENLEMLGSQWNTEAEPQFLESQSSLPSAAKLPGQPVRFAPTSQGVPFQNFAASPTTNQDVIDKAFKMLISGVKNRNYQPEVFGDEFTDKAFEQLLGGNMAYDSKPQVQIPDEAFDAKVADIAQNLGTDPEHLFAVMNFETGGTLDPSQKNKAGSGATGLIQFMPSTAKELTGADTKEAAIQLMSSMSPIEQLDYVEKYLKPFKGKIKSLDDMYMAVLYPKAVGKDPEYALFKKGTKAYWQNRGLDIDKNGVITKMEAAQKVSTYKV